MSKEPIYTKEQTSEATWYYRETGMQLLMVMLKDGSALLCLTSEEELKATAYETTAPAQPSTAEEFGEALGKVYDDIRTSMHAFNNQ